MMYYIVNADGRVVASANRPVNQADLATRGEIMVASDVSLSLDQVEVQGFPSKPVVVEKRAPAPLPRLVLMTSAADTDGDGLPELPADGRSPADLTAILLDAGGAALQGPVEVQFRTCAGTLTRRNAVTKGGQATVQLRSSRETVMATVRVFAEGFEPASLSLEFVPTQTEKNIHDKAIGTKAQRAARRI